MAIKQNISGNVKEMFTSLGYEYADFVKYMEEKDTFSHQKMINSLDYTVIDIINKFTQKINNDIQLKIKSHNTKKHYLSFLSRFSKFINKNHNDLLFQDLNENIFYSFVDYTNEINNKKLVHSSINTYITIIKKICTFAAENDYVSKNFNYKFNKISYTKLPRYLSEEQVSDLFNEITLHKNAYLWKPLFITMLWTGLRIHELSALKVNDFDVKNKTIITLGKGNKERYLPIYPELKKVLFSYLKTTGVKDYRFASGYLFSRNFGNNREKPISIRNIQYNFLNFANKINLDKHLTVHSLRHTFAVNALKEGMGQPYLMQVLGHSSSSSTDIYTQLLPIDLQKVVQEKYPIPLEKILKKLLD